MQEPSQELHYNSILWQHVARQNHSHSVAQILWSLGLHLFTNTWSVVAFISVPRVEQPVGLLWRLLKVLSLAAEGLLLTARAFTNIRTAMSCFEDCSVKTPSCCAGVHR